MRVPRIIGVKSEKFYRRRAFVLLALGETCLLIIAAQGFRIREVRVAARCFPCGLPVIRNGTQLALLGYLERKLEIPGVVTRDYVSGTHFSVPLWSRHYLLIGSLRGYVYAGLTTPTAKGARGTARELVGAPGIALAEVEAEPSMGMVACEESDIQLFVDQRQAWNDAKTTGGQSCFAMRLSILWPMALNTGGLALWVLLYSGRQRSERRAGLCLKCKYDLRGNLSGRCPECGTPILPSHKLDAPTEEERFNPPGT